MLTVSGYTKTIKLAIQSVRGWSLDEDHVILAKSAWPINHLYLATGWNLQILISCSLRDQVVNLNFNYGIIITLRALRAAETHFIITLWQRKFKWILYFVSETKSGVLVTSFFFIELRKHSWRFGSAQIVNARAVDENFSQLCFCFQAFTCMKKNGPPSLAPLWLCSRALN